MEKYCPAAAEGLAGEQLARGSRAGAAMSKFFCVRSIEPITPASELTPAPKLRLPVFFSLTVDHGVAVVVAWGRPAG